MTLAVVACGGDEDTDRRAAGSTPDDAAASSDGTAERPMPAMTRDEAESRTREQTAVFPRIDRLESKLTTWGAFVDASGDDVHTADREAQVWVVAVSGTYRARSAPAGITPPDFPWGIVVYDAETGSGLASGGGPDGAWPPYFDGLSDLSR